MSAKKKCPWLNCPKELHCLFCDFGTRVEVVELCIDSNDKEKYCIKVLDFVGEFYSTVEGGVVFHGEFGNYAEDFTYDFKSIEEVASKWFLDLLSNKLFEFEKIKMDLIGKSNDYEGKKELLDVKSLEINIPDNNYEDGLLEWWLEKFTDKIDCLKINSAKKSEVVVQFPERFNICRKVLDIKGHFVIPQSAFPRIEAEKIFFQDYSKGTNINNELFVLVLKDWMACLTKRKEITFFANYEETDIVEKVYDRMKNNEFSFEKDELTDGYTYKGLDVTMTFYKNATAFNITIFQTLENLKYVEQSKK